MNDKPSDTWKGNDFDETLDLVYRSRSEIDLDSGSCLQEKLEKLKGIERGIDNLGKQKAQLVISLNTLERVLFIESMLDVDQIINKRHL